MLQITSFSSKLDLLKKTHDIEEKERDRAKREVEKRNEKFSVIKSKNDNACLIAKNSVDFKKNETARRELVAKMKNPENPIHTFLTPLIDVIDYNQGTFIISD